MTVSIVGTYGSDQISTFLASVTGVHFDGVMLFIGHVFSERVTHGKCRAPQTAAKWCQNKSRVQRVNPAKPSAAVCLTSPLLRRLETRGHCLFTLLWMAVLGSSLASKFPEKSPSASSQARQLLVHGLRCMAQREVPELGVHVPLGSCTSQIQLAQIRLFPFWGWAAFQN